MGEDRGLYFRMGVTASEPSGSGWIPVSAQSGNNKVVPPPRSVEIIEFSVLFDMTTESGLFMCVCLLYCLCCSSGTTVGIVGS